MEELGGLQAQVAEIRITGQDSTPITVEKLPSTFLRHGKPHGRKVECQQFAVASQCREACHFPAAVMTLSRVDINRGRGYLS